MLLNVCVVALLVFVGELLLLARKKISSLCFILALILGIAFSLSQMNSGSVVHLLTLPMFKEYALVFRYLGVQPAIAYNGLFFR